MAKHKKSVEKVAETATNEPTAEEIAKVQTMHPLDMPEWYASGAQLVIAGNDAQLIFNKPVLLGQVAHGGPQMSQTVGLITPVGVVRLSMATLKDISVMLSNQIAKREAEFGVIETDYTKQEAQKQTAASKKKH
jgi:hypothetical protein